MIQLSLFPELDETKPETYVASINSDCKKALQVMVDNGLKVDSIVTDPPYEIAFMNKDFDKTGIAHDVELWKLCLEVLTPGGHLLAFGGSRTYHRMACAIEDAGFEIRDQIMYIYGQGFPKSLNIGKAIDRMAGAEREVLGLSKEPARYTKESITAGSSNGGVQGGHNYKSEFNITAPATDAAKQWDGWGSALKPAHEPIVMARKPLDKGCNIAQNVLRHGTGGINVDGCRVEHNGQNIASAKIDRSPKNFGGLDVKIGEPSWIPSQGRFPANLIHDGGEEVEAEFAKYGIKKTNAGTYRKDATFNPEGINLCATRKKDTVVSLGDSGSASRFFYSAKASKKDRCNSKHPTVKPIALMRYLCRLITPPNGIVLDPFAGTGTTGQAAQEEGFHAILIEKDETYFQDIVRRIYGKQNQAD